MQVLVARVGKAHGLRGELTVRVHTDVPEQRLAAGSVLVTDPPGAGPLTVRSSRVHHGVRLLRLDGVSDRDAADALRGVRLLADVPDDAEDGWYPEQLTGLRVQTPDGAVVGEVAGLQTRPAQDLLEVRLTSGARVLVPFVHALVPVVDVPGGRVVVDPPAGLLDLTAEG